MTLDTMRDLFGPGVVLMLLQVAAIPAQSADFWGLLERYGLPTVLLIVFYFHTSRKEAARDKERQKFWTDNNDYLRALIAEMRKSQYCHYQKYGNKKSSIE